MKNRICTKFSLWKPVANIDFEKFAPIAKVVVAKFAHFTHFVQTWQPLLLQWMQTLAKSTFATGLHKANFVQI